MIEKKLQQLHTLRDIHLTQEEKGSLRASIARRIQVEESKPRMSMVYTGVGHSLRIALSTFLFVVFVGGSVSVVANNSLPGDPLYSFKVHVNEEVKGAFLRTSEEKLTWQRTRIDTRLSEIKTLAATNTLTKEKQETAQKALDVHVEALSKELTTLSDSEPTKALVVTATLETSLNEQKEDIKKYIFLDNAEHQDDALKAVEGALKKVSDEEVKIISKEIDQISRDLQKVSDGTTTYSLDVPVTPLPNSLPTSNSSAPAQ